LTKIDYSLTIRSPLGSEYVTIQVRERERERERETAVPSESRQSLS
jgi:hypothetical protein